MKRILFAATIILSMGSCYNDNYHDLYLAKKDTTVTNTCDTTGTITFTAAILPILTANCSTNSASCHAAGGTGGINLNSWSSLLATYGNNGQLLRDINFSGGNNMPKDASQLAACDINKITRWVHLGALNN
jgi:hypothetical protein